MYGSLQLEVVGKLTRSEVLCVVEVLGKPIRRRIDAQKLKDTDRRVGLAVLAGVLKNLTRLTDLKLTVGYSLESSTEQTEAEVLAHESRFEIQDLLPRRQVLAQCNPDGIVCIKNMSMYFQFC